MNTSKSTFVLLVAYESCKGSSWESKKSIAMYPLKMDKMFFFIFSHFPCTTSSANELQKSTETTFPAFLNATFKQVFKQIGQNQNIGHFF